MIVQAQLLAAYVELLSGAVTCKGGMTGRKGE